MQIQIATQRRAQKVRMAKLVRTEHQQVTWSTITVVANATRIFEETIAKQPRHAPQGTMDKPAKTMARRWVHLPQTTANVPVLWGTKGATANHQRNARRERMGMYVRTMDLQLEQRATVLASAKPGTQETTVKRSCSAPKPPMEKSVKMGVQLQEQWRQTIASANAPNSWKVQIAKSAQVACIFSIRIVSLAEKETITVVHRVNSKVVQCVRVSFFASLGFFFCISLCRSSGFVLCPNFHRGKNCFCTLSFLTLLVVVVLLFFRRPMNLIHLIALIVLVVVL